MSLFMQVWSTVQTVLCGNMEREESPAQRLKDKDKRRASYYQFYTDMTWGYAPNYHLSLDSGEIGIEKCADIIINLYQSKK